MRRVAILLALVALPGCRDPEVPEAATRHYCPNTASWCDEGYGCPPIAGGPCQGIDDTDFGPGDPNSTAPAGWARRTRDAGARLEMHNHIDCRVEAGAPAWCDGG